MENGKQREYGVRHELVNGTALLRTVTDQYLAHAKLSKAERAFLARDLYTGDVQLVRPTVTQSAWLAVVNSTYAHWAIRRPERERALIESGALPLLPPMKTLPPPVSVSPEEQLAGVVRAFGGITNTINALAMIEHAA